MSSNIKNIISYLSILLAIFTINLDSKNLLDTSFLMFDSMKHKVEIGIDYIPHQSLKFQDGFIVESHRIDFQNSFGVIPSPYISLKSKGYSIGQHFGLYLNTNFRYSNYNMQRAVLTDGSVSEVETDLKTSIHHLSINAIPSFFYYLNFGKNRGKNTFVFEVFSGIGTSVYIGKIKNFIYPTQEEFQREQNISKSEIPPNFQISKNGTVAYIGEIEDLGFGFGFNLIYGVKLKYIYQKFNFHLSYQAPIIITTKDYLNIQQILVGIGYSF